MSISLKNHEDRITSLESIKRGLKINSIYSSSTGIRLSNMATGNVSSWITLCDYDPTVDFYLIETCTETSEYDNIVTNSQQKIISTFGLTVSNGNSSNFVEIFHHTSGDLIETCFIGVHQNKLKAICTDTFGQNGNWVRKIATLKLYYSFSYNIIYRTKHLLERIFFLCLNNRRC